jgi:hypothetical protein
MADVIMDVILETVIPKSHLSTVIRLWLFHKEKVDADGIFLK